MDHIGRKQLPHGPPPWACDPSKETYFLTLCSQNRSGCPLLQGDTPAKLLEAVRFYNDQQKWWTSLAVVMPDHMHLLTSFPEDLAPTVRAWKHWTGRNLKVNWQRDFFDHRLRREEKLDETSSYILHNPVRAGLVDEWRKWPHIWIGAE